MQEISFESLRNDFHSLCTSINEEKEPVTLTLKSNRKVYILPEEDFNQVQRFCVTFSSNTTANTKMK